MAYQWETVARAVQLARERARLTRGELAALSGVETDVVARLEGLRTRGRRRLLNRHYARVAAVERVLAWPEGRVRAIALGFCDPDTSAWKVGDPVKDEFVRQLRNIGLPRETADVLTIVYLEELARERLARRGL